MGLGVEGDGLVTGVQASHVALAAVHAEVIRNDWELLFLRHLGDVLDVLGALAQDVLDGGHFLDVNFSWLFFGSPQLEVVLELKN